MKRELFVFTLAFLQVVTVQGACVQNSAAHQTEQAGNQVEMKLYRATISEWNSKDGSANVAVQVSSAANTYCAANPGTCGVTSCCTDPFKDLYVGTGSGYPQMEKKDMLLRIYLDIPSGLNASGTPECVVNVAALRTIVGEARQGIYDSTGYWITYVDTEFYGIPPNKELNAIIIPISCVVVLFLAIITIVCHFVQKKREDQNMKKKRLQQRMSKSKVSPTYDIKEEPKTVKGLDAHNTKPEKPKRKEKLYKDRKSQMKNASIHSEDSAIKSDTDPRQRHGYGYDNGAMGYGDVDATQYGHLKPLQTGEAEVPSPERKKSKKKKKKHSKEKMEPTYDDTGERLDSKKKGRNKSAKF